MGYLPLQLKAIFTSYAYITTGNEVVKSAMGNVEPLVLAAIIIFAIVFGLRKLDQAEKHPGLVMVIAIQAIVKIIAFLAVGFFVTYFLYDGFGDIFSRIASNEALSAVQRGNTPSYSLFMAYTILSFSAIMFLPRQFHMSVVENTSEKFVRTATWLLPVYFIAITIFVFPIALAGILKGYDVKTADIFILQLPLKQGNLWLSMLVFIGGFSAAISMIMISALTVATMTSNHLILPLFEKIKISAFFRRHLLGLRWVVISLIIIIAYLFEEVAGSSYTLVKIGMVSFAAVLQFAPSIIGALFWKKGNKAGTIMGLTAGFILWGYTSLMPTFVRSGWLSQSLLSDGPLGIHFLNPEKLFGITSLNPLALTVLLTMLFNGGFYILGSLFFRQGESEKQIAADFLDIMKKKDVFLHSAAKQESDIVIENKIKTISTVFNRYLKSEDAEKVIQQCLMEANLINKDKIILSELVELCNVSEKTLARYIGASSASEALAREEIFTKEETARLSDVYAKMAAEMRLTPGEMSEKINYYAEKENLMKKQEKDLEEMVKKRTRELEEKNKELEKFQDITVGREMVMINLKEKIKDLEAKVNSSQ